MSENPSLLQDFATIVTFVPSGTNSHFMKWFIHISLLYSARALLFFLILAEEYET